MATSQPHPRVLRVLPGAAAAPGLALGGVDPLAVAAHVVLRVGGDGPHVGSDALVELEGVVDVGSASGLMESSFE